jgi:hypothetical protein
MAANITLDRSAPEVLATRVLAKHVSTGKHTSYNLKLAAWRDEETTTVTVAPDVYRQQPVGSTVCVNAAKGALGVRWYVVTTCR